MHEEAGPVGSPDHVRVDELAEDQRPDCGGETEELFVGGRLQRGRWAAGSLSSVRRPSGHELARDV